MAVKKPVWKGRVYEDFEVGDIYRHPLGRTVTQTDNIWFTLLTQNTAPIHFDAPLRRADRVQAPAGGFDLHGGAGHRSERDRHFAERVRQPRLGRDPAPHPGVRGRYHLLAVGSAGKARVEVAPQRRHRDGENHGVQPGRHHRHHLQAHRNGVQARPRADHSSTQPEELSQDRVIGAATSPVPVRNLGLDRIMRTIIIIIQGASRS